MSLLSEGMMKKKPRITFTMSHSAARLSLRVTIYGSAEKTENEESVKSTETRGFPSPSLNGFGFIEDWK